MTTQELLTKYLETNGSSAGIYMESLAEEIRRTIKRGLAKREVSDLEDFEEDCFVAVWMRIEAIKGGAPVDTIENLEGFVRRTVHNRYCDAIRRKRPSWYNLKLELLETFSGKLNIKGFAIWHSSTTSERLCGFDVWQGRNDSMSGACREVADSPAKFLKSVLANRDPAEMSVPELAAKLLDWCGGPIEIDELTSCLAALRQVRDVEPLSIDSQPESDEEADSPIDWLLASDVDVEEQVIGQGWLKQVLGWFWTEFRELNPKQRKAIFLGLTTEQAVAVIASCGIDNIAQSLDLDVAALSKILGRLPLADALIAEILGIPARSVPSVRFKAWRRIQRRAKRSELVEID